MTTDKVGPEASDYYVRRKEEIISKFHAECDRWRDIICGQWKSEFANSVLTVAGRHMASLITELPYIGGDDNHLTNSLIGSAYCLALFRAMEEHGTSAEETGRVLYDAEVAQLEKDPPIPPDQVLSRTELMERRRERALRSQEREFTWDWVYEFVEGDGETCDYGYDFVECATAKFYHAQGADEFLPFYCFLDFPKCECIGLGLTRTMTLAEGFDRCDFRFKEGAKASQRWPPAFLLDRDRG